MRGRKGKVDSPGMVISTGMYMGLVALVRIMRDRTNKKTKKFYQRVEKMWASAREALNEMNFHEKIGFSPIQTAESNMRGQQHKFSFTSLRRFGNRETKRVYSWVEGTVGPFNALLNYAGARLRELAMIFYPFPQPQAFHIREYPDGTTKVFTKAQAEKISDDDAIKTYWRYGYERTGKIPRVFLAHPTLPGMDFVDMMRAHCVELCRQCFIYHVPVTEAHRYIRLLIHRLKPFLDWIYTDGQEGRKGFNPYADQELRKIVLEMRALYTKRSRTRQRVSNRGRERTNSLTYETIRNAVITQLEDTTDKSDPEALLTFLDYFDTATVPEGEETEAVFGAVQQEILKRIDGTANEQELRALKRLNRIIKTISLEDKDGKTKFERIREKIIKQVSKTTDEAERMHLLDLLDYLDIRSGVIQDRDIEKLSEQILALAQREGNEWHRILFSDLHHPASLRQVVFAGDKMLDSLSSVQVVAELPVARRSGMVDLTIFIRRKIEGVEGQVLWTPVMILEVKTKTAFALNLYGFRLKRKRKQVSTPAFYAWKRAMSEDEWNEILSSGPDTNALGQLKTYSGELLAEYRGLATHDPTPPTALWKGVIVLDTDQSLIETYQAFQYLLEELTTGFIHQLVEQDTSIAVTPEPLASGDDTPKVAMFIAPSSGPDSLLSEMVPSTSLPIEDPFSKREIDSRELTLYVSIASPTSSGVTSARLSRNWHLLHHIKECLETSRTPIEVVWLDLMGDYKNNELLQKRMGLDVLLSEKMISPEIHQELSNTLRSIRFVDLSIFSTEIITGGEDEVSNLAQHIGTILPENEEYQRIIILDGWVDFKEMVPGHHQFQVRNLEKQLLKSLPQSNVNIIWIDSGNPHTKMNSHYQRKCISPLRHDSPRRTHLDEIIYNIPSTPWRFGWVTPQQENVRIIVQDTPTQAAPWKVAIHVPQLVGFAKKFQGLARRDGIVPPEIVAQDFPSIHPMYGRDVTLSRTCVSSESFSGRSLDTVLDNAMTLVPSVLRLRTLIDDDMEEEPSPKETLLQTTVQAVSSSGGVPLKRRIRVDTTRPPPRPKGSRRYFDTLTEMKTGDITRPWSYHRTPKQVPDEDEEKNLYVSTYVPDVRPSKVDKIDTTATRRKELRRLFYAVRYLKGQQSISDDLRNCCTKIEEFCKRQFALLQKEPSQNTSEFFRDALLKIKGFILKDPLREEIWNTLLPLRQGLPDLLNSENKEVLRDVLDVNPVLFTLYGNNLFLAVLAAMGKNSISLAEPLWNSIAEWTFRQIGMHVQDDEVRCVYSFQTLVSNLRSRVKTLSRLNLPEKFSGQGQLGAIFWQKEEEQFNALVLIPHKGEYLTGLIKHIRDKQLQGIWSKCVTDPQELMQFAKGCHSSPDSFPVILSTVEESQVLWVPWKDEEANEFRWDSFIFEHGPHGGRGNIIPWMKLTYLSSKPASSIPEVPMVVNETLERMTRSKHEYIQVKLEVYTDLEKEVYLVDLKGESFTERLEFTQTHDLVRFLRDPIRSGGGYYSKTQRMTLTWDHREVISYVEDKRVSFLIPLVHVSSFYPEAYHYPKTSRGLFAVECGPEVIMVIKKMVIVDKDTYERKTRFMVELGNLPATSTLKKLEKIQFKRSELVLLTECEELFDIKLGTMYPVSLDVSDVVDVRFPEVDEDSRLSKAIKTWEEDMVQEEVEMSAHSISTESERTEVSPYTYRGEVSMVQDKYVLTVTGYRGKERIVKTITFSEGEAVDISNHLMDDPFADDAHDLSKYNMENRDDLLQILEDIQTGEVLLEDESEEDESVEDECEQHISRLKEIVGTDPKRRADIGRSLINTGEIYWNQGAREVALRYLEEGIAQLEMYDPLIFPLYLTKVYLLRAEYQVSLGCGTREGIEDAIQKVQSIEQMVTPSTTDILYRAAIEKLKKIVEFLRELPKEHTES